MNLQQTVRTFGMDDQSWLGSEHGTQATESITLDVSTFTPATHYPAGYFKSGIPLGQITATKKFGPYSAGASDGRETLVGFLYAAVGAPAVNTTDVSGAMFTHGKVRESRLPVAVDAAGKADVAGSIRFV
ncbi:head decoration protein [Streptomyces sp. NBC_00247]|uniref:head decoration protein n=1 Tax=Streptomyces sp. NBC_00247 TaxID=2975689 RepID=UPI002E2A5A5D|nr:head decoration protein [Streptomyces sp. NBC_00247]